MTRGRARDRNRRGGRFAARNRRGGASRPPSSFPRCFPSIGSPRADSAFFGQSLGRSENAHQETERLWSELNELEANVKPRRSPLIERLHPDDFSRIRGGFLVRKKKLQLEELANLRGIVAVYAHASQANVDGLALPGEKLHAGWPHVQRRLYASTQSPVYHGQPFRNLGSPGSGAGASEFETLSTDSSFSFSSLANGGPLRHRQDSVRQRRAESAACGDLDRSTSGGPWTFRGSIDEAWFEALLSTPFRDSLTPDTQKSEASLCVTLAAKGGKLEAARPR